MVLNGKKICQNSMKSFLKKMVMNDLPFLSERMKIKRFSKSVCNLYDKNEYLAHIRTLKQAVNHGLILK